jgi:hypothetical protein
MGADGFKQGPTDAGEYLVSHCGRHVTHRYPDWSGVPWGTPSKEESASRAVMVQFQRGSHGR